MKVLVVNVGSTSVKYNLYEMDTEARLAVGKAERIDEYAVHIHETGQDPVDGSIANAMRAILAHLTREGGPLTDPSQLGCVGHRVVHGGERLIAPTRIDDKVLAIIDECSVFAPLHNPVNGAGIRAAREVFPNIPHVAVFDTAFHAQLPPHAYTYAIPHELYLQKGVRRYGFHGPSHQFMALSAAEHLKTDLSQLKLVTCHLGGGASVAAIDGGVSVETSMGMTPLEGLATGTRSGDLDSLQAPLLLARDGMSFDAITSCSIASRASPGCPASVRTFAISRPPRRRAMFVRASRSCVRASCAQVHRRVRSGARWRDALVFTGGIGGTTALSYAVA